MLLQNVYDLLSLLRVTICPKVVLQESITKHCDVVQLFLTVRECEVCRIFLPV